MQEQLLEELCVFVAVANEHLVSFGGWHNGFRPVVVVLGSRFGSCSRCLGHGSRNVWTRLRRRSKHPLQVLVHSLVVCGGPLNRGFHPWTKHLKEYPPWRAFLWFIRSFGVAVLLDGA